MGDVNEAEHVSTARTNVSDKDCAFPVYPLAILFYRYIDDICICIAKGLLEHRVWKPYDYLVNDEVTVRVHGRLQAVNECGIEALNWIPSGSPPFCQNA